MGRPRFHPLNPEKSRRSMTPNPSRRSNLSARLGAVATAFVVLGGCSGTDGEDVSLRALSVTVSRQAVALNEALDFVTFADGCPQTVKGYLD